jgi:hypothetical protein
MPGLWHSDYAALGWTYVHLLFDREGPASLASRLLPASLSYNEGMGDDARSEVGVASVSSEKEKKGKAAAQEMMQQLVQQSSTSAEVDKERLLFFARKNRMDGYEEEEVLIEKIDKAEKMMMDESINDETRQRWKVRVGRLKAEYDKRFNDIRTPA